MTDYIISRKDLMKVYDGNARNVAAFEIQQRRLAVLDEVVIANVAGTQAVKDGSFLTLSPNAELTNERVLAFGRGMVFALSATQLTLSTDSPNIIGAFSVKFTVSANANLTLPLAGTVATLAGAETFSNKTLAAPSVSGLGNYANDAAAAAGGVPVGGIYRTVNALQVRLV